MSASPPLQNNHSQVSLFFITATYLLNWQRWTSSSLQPTDKIGKIQISALNTTQSCSWIEAGVWDNICFSSTAKQPFVCPSLLHHSNLLNWQMWTSSSQQPTKLAKVKKRVVKPRLLEWSKTDITSLAGVKAHLSKQYFVEQQRSNRSTHPISSSMQ